MLCDRMLSVRVTGRIYTRFVRPALMYGIEMVAATGREVKKLEVAELKMVRWVLGVTRKVKIRNEHIRGIVKIARLEEKLRGARRRWCGHVRRRYAGYVGRRMLELGVPGRGRGGRLKMRWVDMIREDLEKACVREGKVEDRKVWKTRCGDPE